MIYFLKKGVDNFFSETKGVMFSFEEKRGAVTFLHQKKGKAKIFFKENVSCDLYEKFYPIYFPAYQNRITSDVRLSGVRLHSCCYVFTGVMTCR